MVSTIKTSIDDVTLMELAKKGISAMTPVAAKKPPQQQNNALRISSTHENLNEEENKMSFF